MNQHCNGNCKAKLTLVMLGWECASLDYAACSQEVGLVTLLGVEGGTGHNSTPPHKRIVFQGCSFVLLFSIVLCKLCLLHLEYDLKHSCPQRPLSSWSVQRIPVSISLVELNILSMPRVFVLYSEPIKKKTHYEGHF